MKKQSSKKRRRYDAEFKSNILKMHKQAVVTRTEVRVRAWSGLPSAALMAHAPFFGKKKRRRSVMNGAAFHSAGRSFSKIYMAFPCEPCTFALKKSLHEK